MMILMGVLERKGEYNAKYFYFSFRGFCGKKVWKYWLCLLTFLFPAFSSDSCVRLIAIFMLFKGCVSSYLFLTCESREI